MNGDEQQQRVHREVLCRDHAGAGNERAFPKSDSRSTGDCGRLSCTTSTASPTTPAAASHQAIGDRARGERQQHERRTD